MHGDAACGKAKDSDVIRIAPKRCDVAFDPLEGSDLIHVRIVALQLVGTLAANAFYLTMQFYYFYAFVALSLAIPVVFAQPRE